MRNKILAGRDSYDSRTGIRPYGGAWKGPTVVLTHHPEDVRLCRSLGWRPPRRAGLRAHPRHTTSSAEQLDPRRLFGPDRVELQLIRVLDAPVVTHLRYRVAPRETA